MNKNITIITLYKFVQLEDYIELQKKLTEKCNHLKIKGTILLAKEGINGTVAGKNDDIEQIIDYFLKDLRLQNIDVKKSFANFNPFLRMKIKLKKEIVTIGLPSVKPGQTAGEYVEPESWNKLINDPDTILIDTRNDYEYEIGTFKGAINPKIENFRNFPQYVKQTLNSNKHKKIAMFCTGGIRCEKASSYMLQQGFEKIYHLKRGILKYLEKIPRQQSTWNGECFVFDNRVAINHDLEVGTYDQCYGCRYPITQDDKQSDKYIKGVTCPRCFDKTSSMQKKKFSDRQLQITLAKQKGIRHMGDNRGY